MLGCVLNGWLFFLLLRRERVSAGLALFAGAALQISEDAARMRTDRALEKMRVALGKRGMTSSAAALGAIVGSHSAFPAPAGMGALLASKSLAAVAATARGQREARYGEQDSRAYDLPGHLPLLWARTLCDITVSLASSWSQQPPRPHG